MTLGAVGGVEAFPNDFGIGRNYRAGAHRSPGNLTGIENISPETTAIKEKVATSPKSNDHAERQKPTRNRGVALGGGLGQMMGFVRIHGYLIGASGRE